ncbi:MAG: zinc ribbon domain-containing protein [Dehalococcoidia bacterium]
MFCEECGARMAAAARFCPACGAAVAPPVAATSETRVTSSLLPLDTQPPGWLCPHCGQVNPEAVGFCQYCGVHAGVAAQPSAPARTPLLRRGIVLGTLGAAAAVIALAGGMCVVFGGSDDDDDGPQQPAAAVTESPAAGASPGGAAAPPAGSPPSGASSTPSRSPQASGGQGSESVERTPTPTLVATATPSRTTAAGGSPTASPTRTATPAATPTRTATPTSTPTRTPTPNPTPTPTATPVPVSIPGTGSWSWRGTLVSNDCPFEPNPVRTGTYRWAETNGNGKLEPGERVNVTWAEFGYSDTRTFSYPQFTFSIGLVRGSWNGSDTHTVTFSADGQVTVDSVVEHFPSQPCSIVWAPD